MRELGNNYVKSLKESATLKMNDKEKKMIHDGIDVVNLAGGEPNFDTPKQIKDATIQAKWAGRLHYVLFPSRPLPMGPGGQNKAASLPPYLRISVFSCRAALMASPHSRRSGWPPLPAPPWGR